MTEKWWGLVFFSALVLSLVALIIWDGTRRRVPDLQIATPKGFLLIYIDPIPEAEEISKRRVTAHWELDLDDEFELAEIFEEAGLPQHVALECAAAVRALR